MDTQTLQTICTLRAVVGYLGEREQFGWWQSAFFAPSSSAFLAPLFSRTQVLAQVCGVTRAAALIHDERIGIGRVYHLFRLPEEMERGVYQAMHDSELCTHIAALVASKAAALDHLQKGAGAQAENAMGPTHIGTLSTLRDRSLWLKAAQFYSQAFEHKTPIFPYFTDQV